MAKELPYFRFTAQEWQNGDISLESYEHKGLFIDICAYYWIKNCSITLAMLEKRFSNDNNLLHDLVDLNIIDVSSEDDFISISFLDSQFDMLSEKRKRRQDAGREGGLKRSSNAKAMLKQKSSYKDKDKDKENNKDNDNIAKSQQTFYDSLKEYVKEFGSDTVRDFYDYWSEPNKSNTKIKYELEKTWDTKRRLKRWIGNNYSKGSTTSKDSPKSIKSTAK